MKAIFSPTEENLNIEHNKKMLIIKALNQSHKVKGAASLLGISERTLFRYINDFSIVRMPGQYKDTFFYKLKDAA